MSHAPFDIERNTRALRADMVLTSRVRSGAKAGWPGTATTEDPDGDEEARCSILHWIVKPDWECFVAVRKTLSRVQDSGVRGHAPRP